MKKIKELWKNRTVRLTFLLVVALILLLVAYKVFAGGETKKSSRYEPTAREERLIVLLTGIEGVRDAKVMITEEGGVAVGVVILYEGEDAFLTRLRILDVASTALNIDRTAVVVYAA